MYVTSSIWEICQICTGLILFLSLEGFLLPIISWLLMSIVQIRELKRFTWEGLWLIRFPLVLVTAGQLTKFSFIYRLVDHNLFFILYIVYVSVHAFLAIFAITHIPRSRSLVPSVSPGSGYQVSIYWFLSKGSMLIDSIWIA